jgi:energy-coupling factor transport system ATP-binding protein
VTRGLVCEDLSHRYPGAESDALSGVDLAIRPGERVALIGANGSGKSTLLLLLKGLLAPGSGRVSIDGRSPADGEPPAHLSVGMIFQNPDDQIVATRVDEDVAFGPENLDIAGDELSRRVAAALAAVGLNDMAAREPHTLSGGEKQRLAIAGALALEPAYLLVDEATSMLDAEGRAQVRATLADVARSGEVGIVEVTHDLGDALDAERAVVLAGGRIAASGDPRAIVGDQKLLERVGLVPLPATRLAARLAAYGVAVPADAMTAAEIVSAL